MEHIIAIDEKGNVFTKEVELLHNDRGCIVSLGFPISWEWESIKIAPREGSKVCIDAQGRNHRGSAVWIVHSDLIKAVDNLRKNHGNSST